MEIFEAIKVLLDARNTAYGEKQLYLEMEKEKELYKDAVVITGHAAALYIGGMHFLLEPMVLHINVVDHNKVILIKEF